MAGCTGAERRHEKLLLALRPFRVLLQRLWRNRRRRNEHEVGAHDVRDRSEVLLRIVGKLVVSARRNAQLRDFAEQQCVAVRRGACDLLGRDETGGSRLVLHDDGRPPRFLQLLRHDARRHVRTGARGEPDDKPDRLVRVLLAIRAIRRYAKQCQRGEREAGDASNRRNQRESRRCAREHVGLLEAVRRAGVAAKDPRLRARRSTVWRTRSCSRPPRFPDQCSAQTSDRDKAAG
jgi:hypothetical protein